VIGGGFAGIYQLDRLRSLGHSVKVFEAGERLGGIWYWNCYPGARVDTEGPLYQFAYKDLWKNWEWRQLYPGWSEVREYFAYVDRTLDISKDVRFNARVLPPPSLALPSEGTSGGRPNKGADDWSNLPVPAPVDDAAGPIAGSFFEEGSDNGGVRREPILPDHEAIAAEEPKPSTEFNFSDDESDDDAIRAGKLRQRFGTVARQAALDPDDGISL